MVVVILVSRSGPMPFGRQHIMPPRANCNRASGIFFLPGHGHRPWAPAAGTGGGHRPWAPGGTGIGARVELVRGWIVAIANHSRLASFPSQIIPNSHHSRLAPLPRPISPDSHHHLRPLFAHCARHHPNTQHEAFRAGEDDPRGSMTQGRGKMTQGRDLWQSICLRIALTLLDAFASRLAPTVCSNQKCQLLKISPPGVFW